MLSALLSRLILLVFGTLYPAYASHKAVKTKNVKEYVKWMMYWIVFALYTFVEIFTDIFVAFWMPFYYEIKIAFVLWLTCPATKGSSYIYRKIVHPYLHSHEEQIDAHLNRVWDSGYEFFRQLGSQGVSYLFKLSVELFKKGQMTFSAKLPELITLAQEMNRNEVDGGDTGVGVDDNGVDFADYDVVDSHEINDAFLSAGEGEDAMIMPDISSKYYPDMGLESDEDLTVESRPLRFQGGPRSSKKDTPEDVTVSAPPTKSGKVRQRRSTRK